MYNKTNLSTLFQFDLDNAGSSNEQNTPTTEPYAENVRGQVFTVGPRYTSLQYIGEGAYGMVV